MAEPEKEFQPFVPASESPPEFTLAPVIVGSLLGLIFGASSMYLVLKVGMTVSASIPVAVLAFALFRGVSAAFGLRKRTVLENNIVQTAGSAGESIAFGVGLVMPALLVLGFDIDVIRVMTVGVQSPARACRSISLPKRRLNSPASRRPKTSERTMANSTTKVVTLIPPAVPALWRVRVRWPCICPRS